MTTLLLVRHALCDPVGRSIAGRAPGVHLNAEGAVQARALGLALAGLPIEAVYSSPMERALETAQPIAAGLGLSVLPAPGLAEIDFGEWTGRTLAELDPLPLWRAFNAFRSGTRIPGGELMTEVVTRALTALVAIHREHEGKVVAAVSHGDVIRGLVAHAAGIPLDLMQRLEVSPASVSAISLEDHAVRVLGLNWRTEGWAALLG